MALAANEVWSRGFVRDTTSGLFIVTTNPAGTAFRGGFLRDPDGRLLVA